MSQDEGITLMLVEQHAEVALTLTRDAIVPERGPISHSGPSERLLADRDMLNRFAALA